MEQTIKLKRFETAVLAEIEAKAEQIRAEAESYKQQRIEENKDSRLLASYNEIQQQSQEIKKECKRKVAKHALDCKRNLLLKRVEISKRIFEQVEAMLADYVKTPAYQKDLQTGISSLAKKYAIEAAELLVSQRDFENADTLKAAYGLDCTIAEDKTNILGGFILRSTKDGLLFDETLASKFEEEKQRFPQYSELYI